MKFISAAQEKAYKAAIKHKFKAIAFDIDGTLTPFARFIIPDTLMEELNSISPNIPLILCTGRPFGYIKKKIKNIIRHAKDPEVARKQWLIISDNGGSVHAYDTKKKAYIELYSVNWPEKEIKQEVMEAFIKDKLARNIITESPGKTTVVLFHRYLYLFPKFLRPLSVNLAKKLNKILTEMKLEKTLKILDSGLGSHIMPIESGKGHAIKGWAKHAKISLKDVLCIGDSPGPGENDEDFLSGDFGMAFSVGKQTQNTYPLPVLDEKGRKVWGPEGTEYLLRQLIL